MKIRESMVRVRRGVAVTFEKQEHYNVVLRLSAVVVAAATAIAYSTCNYPFVICMGGGFL